MDTENFTFNFREIWRTGKTLGLSDADINSIFISVINEEEYKELQSCLRIQHMNTFRKKHPTKLQRVRTLTLTALKLCIISMGLGILCCVVIYLHNPSKKMVMRNIQDIIYPILTSVRYITLPILRMFPHLTQWYSEECILPNNFFDHLNVDCTPCEGDMSPMSTISLNSFYDTYYNSGKLIVISDAMYNVVTVKSILEKLDFNEEINFGSFQVFPRSKEVNFMTQTEGIHLVKNDIHIEWKINRLKTLHLIRKVFPRVYFIPQDTEVSLHRYLFIDGPMYGPYHLPLTEFANVILIQGEGKSIITMIPSSQCKTICQPVNIFLNASQVLYFNCVYWRPVRQGGNSTSLLLMSSFY